MEADPPSMKGLNPAAIGVGIVVLGGLAAVCFPVILKQRKAADRTWAINRICNMGAMLLEFDSEYGGFPDDKTALEVQRVTKTPFTLTGPYSNDYFRQLLAGGGGKSELPFWCKTALSPDEPDEDFSTPAKALAPGEVGFSYIMASPTEGQSSKGEPSPPVVVAPSYQFRADWTFDPEPYTGKAVILRLDNSAEAFSIREDNRKISTGSGKTLGDTGEGTPWGTKMTPVLRAPQPR